MHLHGVVDVLIPRGGAASSRTAWRRRRWPVIETQTATATCTSTRSADLWAIRPRHHQKREMPPLACATPPRRCCRGRCPPPRASCPRRSPAAARGVTLGTRTARGRRWPRPAARPRWPAGKPTGRPSSCGRPCRARVRRRRRGHRHVNRYGPSISEANRPPRTRPLSMRFLRASTRHAVYATRRRRSPTEPSSGLGAEIGKLTQKLLARVRSRSDSAHLVQLRAARIRARSR